MKNGMKISLKNGLKYGFKNSGKNRIKHCVNKHSIYQLVLTGIFSTGLFSSTPALAVDYFDMDFEDGLQPPVSVPSPVWQLPPSFTTNYGPGNHFEVTDASSHSGTYSMRFNYEARNSFCNTCGVYGGESGSANVLKQIAGLNSTDTFVASTGEDLSRADKLSSIKANDGPAAQPGRIVYNKSNGYSEWEIVDVGNENATNDKLTLKLLKNGYAGENGALNAGDEIVIARQCGVDGHVANNIDRRSDCDNGIIWFGNIQPQAPGSSIFRRVYLKQEITSPRIHQKLFYLRPDRGGPNAGSIVIFADSNPPAENMQPQITGFAPKYGGAPIYKPGFNGFPLNIQFERGVWYYLEIEYKAATLSAPDTYNNDGEYRLWLYESGSESNTPLFELTGLALPPLVGGNGTHASLWGNIQHTVHTRGNWYMDDIKVSDTKIGPAAGGGTNTTPPEKSAASAK